MALRVATRCVVVEYRYDKVHDIVFMLAKHLTQRADRPSCLTMGYGIDLADQAPIYELLLCT